MPFTEMWQASPDPFPCPRYKYLACATSAATDTKLNRTSHGWRPATEQVEKKRAASHGDGEPLLVAKNDLPMRAFCRHIHQPWMGSVSWEILVLMGNAMWLHRPVFLASQRALIHHARPPSSEFPRFLLSACGIGDVSWTHSLYSYMFFISGSEMIFKSL